MTLTREEILAAIGQRKKDVKHIDVPEWGGRIAVRRMTAGDVERTGLGERDRRSLAKVVAACLVDDEGERLFSDEQAADLEEADMETMTKVFTEVLRVNDLLTGDVEEAMATFEAAQHDASSTS